MTGTCGPQVHRPVLAEEIVGLLVTDPDGIYIDGTVGGGGHAETILRRLASMGGKGRLIGMDRDSQILDLARRRLEGFGALFLHGTFENLDRALDLLGVDRVSGLLLDLGVSSLQLDEASRGFSFSKEAPLDMRMNGEDEITAADIIAESSPRELTRILTDYGEEPFAHRIVRNIVEARRRKSIETTTELAQIVWRSVPPSVRHRRIHPATRTFQALRIAVNGEIDRLERFLQTAPSRLSSGGRLAVISYHSLEDRLVKHAFHQGEREGICRRLTKKPVRPSDNEVHDNPRARSARLRVVEKR